VGIDYEIPTEEDVTAFHRILNLEYKLHSTVRRHHGRDINGACGQLALNRPAAVNGEGGGAAPAVNDIEDLMAPRGGLGGGGAVGANGSVVVRRKGDEGTRPRVTFAPGVGGGKSEEGKDCKAGLCGGPSAEAAEDGEEAGAAVAKRRQRRRVVAVGGLDKTTLLLSVVAGASVAVAGAMVVLLIRGQGRARARA
jgi:hypothetical protein